MKKLDTNCLSPDKIRILKRISIKSKLNPNVIGNIIYTRLLTNEYKLKSEKEVYDIKRIIGLMGEEYTRNDCYPNDSIDSSILNAVREIFPDFNVENNLIVNESNLEEIKLFKQRKIAIPSNMNICWDENMNLDCNRSNFNIYSTTNCFDFENQTFDAKIQKSDAVKLSTLQFL